jgi:single-stranded-DNA-specific exonuclease
MKWLRKGAYNTVKELVQANTGMSANDLAYDARSYYYPGIKEAAELFMDHIKHGSKILVWCDYDTDGVDCKFIMSYTIARPMKIRNIEILCPGRYSDGYGIKPSIVEQFAGTDLLVLCDNGIAAIEAVDLAREMGMDVIILDHHDPRVIEGQVVMPNANVIVDPHLTGGYIMDGAGNQIGEFRDLCGAGITWYFTHEVRSMCDWMSDKQKWYLDQIAYIGATFGTVGDVVDLKDDNRRIVKQGLTNLNKGMGTSGIRQLMYKLYLNNVSSMDIGFLISPIINASGRLEDTGANRIAALLCTDANDEGAKKALYAEVDRAIDVNKKRKAMTKESVERVVENYEANGGNDPFIVCYDEYTVSGIVGLVASELVNRYHRPALVFAPSGKDDGVIKGSGRSVEGIGIKGLLDQVQQYLTTYGGHPMACGASLLIDNLDAFGDAVNAITPVLDTSDAIMYDLECTYTEAATKLAEQEQFEPYGAGNPQPVYRINGVELCEPEYMGGNSQHIKFQTKDADILWFDGRKAYENLGSPKMVDMLVTMSYHEFKDQVTVQMQVIDMKPAD